MLQSPPIGLAKHQQLQAIAAQHGCPVLEYSEKVSVPFLILIQLNAE